MMRSRPLRSILALPALAFLTTAIVIGTTHTADAEGPAIQLDLSVASTEDVNGNGTIDPGDTLVFGFSVTNPNTFEIMIVGLDSALLSNQDIDVVCPGDFFDGGTSVTCTQSAPYTVTERDLEAGQVALAATVTAQPNDGDWFAADASLSVPIEAPPVEEPETPEPESPQPVPTATLPDTGA